MKELKVENVIISKQLENSENYQKFLEIVKKKKVKVKTVQAGERIQIEKNLYIDILWPDMSNSINDNILNNNAIVCKLTYKSFSMLFTGDVEEIAEKAILERYKDNLNILKASVLKVAHHGSSTSSIEEFLKAVRPQIGLIGVGENNNFGHPSDITLENLEAISCKTFRTDKDGEISIGVNREGRIKIKKFIN